MKSNGYIYLIIQFFRTYLKTNTWDLLGKSLLNNDDIKIF